jgi:hypothetical protein
MRALEGPVWVAVVGEEEKVSPHSAILQLFSVPHISDTINLK